MTIDEWKEATKYNKVRANKVRYHEVMLHPFFMFQDPDRAERIYNRRVKGGKSFEEVGAEFNLSPWTVRSMVYRINRVKQWMVDNSARRRLVNIPESVKWSRNTLVD